MDKSIPQSRNGSANPVLQIMLRKFAADYKDHEMAAAAMRDAADEIDRLNKWADGMTDAMLKERRLADATIKELQAALAQSSIASEIRATAGGPPPGASSEPDPELTAAAQRSDKNHSPFDKTAADRMAAIVDEMIYAGHLDPRSQLADARLDYGQPFDREKSKTLSAERRAFTPCVKCFTLEACRDGLPCAFGRQDNAPASAIRPTDEDIELMLDNAACASQVCELLRTDDGEETVLREAVRLSVLQMLRRTDRTRASEGS